MVASSERRGALLVFEGVDRSGKTTQTQKLVERLAHEGVSAELWRFPDRTTRIGQMIDSYLQSKSELDDAAIHLLFSANRWEKRQEMLRKLKQGVTLVVDRYAFSGAVFTAAKRIPGLDLQWSKAADVGLPAPDKVFFLNLDVSEAAARGGFGEERYEKKELQTEVRRLYQAISKDVSYWQEVDASQSAEVLHQEIFKMASQEVKECQTGRGLSTLW